MSLATQLHEAVAAARGRGRELSGYLAALMPLAEAGGEESRQALANAKVTLTCIFAELNKIDGVDAAARMTGMIPQPVKAKELELHPAGGERERMILSLHRAGDHTLDEPAAADEATDRNVAIYGEEAR